MKKTDRQSLRNTEHPQGQSLLAQPHIAAFRMRAGSHLDIEARVEVSAVGLMAIAGLVTGILLSVVPIIRAARSR